MDNTGLRKKSLRKKVPTSKLKLAADSSKDQTGNGKNEENILKPTLKSPQEKDDLPLQHLNIKKNISISDVKTDPFANNSIIARGSSNATISNFQNLKKWKNSIQPVVKLDKNAIESYNIKIMQKNTKDNQFSHILDTEVQQEKKQTDLDSHLDPIKRDEALLKVSPSNSNFQDESLPPLPHTKNLSDSSPSIENLELNRTSQDDEGFNSLKSSKEQQNILSKSATEPAYFVLKKIDVSKRRKSILKGSPNLTEDSPGKVISLQSKSRVRITTPSLSDDSSEVNSINFIVQSSSNPSLKDGKIEIKLKSTSKDKQERFESNFEPNLSDLPVNTVMVAPPTKSPTNFPLAINDAEVCATNIEDHLFKSTIPVAIDIENENSSSLQAEKVKILNSEEKQLNSSKLPNLSFKSSQSESTTMETQLNTSSNSSSLLQESTCIINSQAEMSLGKNTKEVESHLASNNEKTNVTDKISSNEEVFTPSKPPKKRISKKVLIKSITPLNKVFVPLNTLPINNAPTNLEALSACLNEPFSNEKAPPSTESKTTKNDCLLLSSTNKSNQESNPANLSLSTLESPATTKRSYKKKKQMNTDSGSLINNYNLASDMPKNQTPKRSYNKGKKKNAALEGINRSDSAVEGSPDKSNNKSSKRSYKKKEKLNLSVNENGSTILETTDPPVCTKDSEANKYPSKMKKIGIDTLKEGLEVVDVPDLSNLLKPPKDSKKNKRPYQRKKKNNPILDRGNKINSEDENINNDLNQLLTESNDSTKVKKVNKRKRKDDSILDSESENINNDPSHTLTDTKDFIKIKRPYKRKKKTDSNLDSEQKNIIDSFNSLDKDKTTDIRDRDQNLSKYTGKVKRKYNRKKKIKSDCDSQSDETDNLGSQNGMPAISDLIKSPPSFKAEITKQTKQRRKIGVKSELKEKKKKEPKSPKKKDAKKSKSTSPKSQIAPLNLPELESGHSQSSIQTAENETANMPLISSATSSDLNKIASETLKRNLSLCLKQEKPEVESTKKKKKGRKRGKIGRKMEEVEEDDDEDDPEERAAAAMGLPKKERKKNQRRTGRRFSVTGNWYIAAGYLNDIINLLEDFDSTDSWRFRGFSECWQKKDFSLIYRGRQTFKELLEFSEEIALLTKRFLGPPHSNKRRIGALYTLYGLYHKFPLGRRHFFNLRFELEEYKHLLDLVQPFRSNMENPDPAYIFRKLELGGAILHCATACEPCYDFHNEEREYVELEYGKQRLAKSSAVSIAAPKVQLQADASLLQHYHLLKAKMAGNEEHPERALAMISPDFISGIASNLAQLRQNTLSELGMFNEDVCINRTIGIDEEAASEKAVNPPPPAIDLLLDLDLEGEPRVDQHLIDVVNNGVSGQRSQMAIRNNEMTKDQTVRDFMRPPSAQDLLRPLRLCKSGAKAPNKAKRKERDEVVSVQPKAHKGCLDIQAAPPEAEELNEVLLPHHLPPKKKRGRKRPIALMKAVTSYPPPRKRLTPPVTKTLSSSSSSSSTFVMTGIGAVGSVTTSSSVQQREHSSATRLLPSDLPDVKPLTKESTTVIRVRMKSGVARKLVKLKVKVSKDQFKDMQRDNARYTSFLSKLKPLIQATQKGESSQKEWLIEDILLPEDALVKDPAPPPPLPKMEKKGEASPPPGPFDKKGISLKERYECLRHSDDDEDYDDDDDVDSVEEMVQARIKREETRDQDYAPPKDEEALEEEEDEPLEYECEDDDSDDLDWEDDSVSKHRWWRKRMNRPRRRWDGSWEDDRGPRDSDMLLKPAKENKSIKMVPMRVGNTVKYFPMIKTDSGPAKKEPETSEEKEVLPSDPSDSFHKYTWNDFSSDKSPPFKKRRNSSKNSSFYLYSPRIRIKSNPADSPSRSKLPPTPRPTPRPTPPTTRSSRSEQSQAMDASLNPPQTASSPVLKETLSPKAHVVKQEVTQTVLESLADDWDEDVFDVSDAEDEATKEPEDSKPYVDIEEDLHVGAEDDAGSHIEAATSDIEAGSHEEALVESSKESILANPILSEFPVEGRAIDQTLSLIAGLDSSFSEEAEVSQILPDLSLPTTSAFGNNIQVIPVQLNKNVALGMSAESFVPGSLLFNDNMTNAEHNPLDSSTLLSSSSFPSEVVRVDMDNLNPKQPLYYKMTAVDGNDIFIPVSSLPQIGSKKIEILSFDVADVKPFSPAKSVTSPFRPAPFASPPPYTNEESLSLSTTTPVSAYSELPFVSMAPSNKLPRDLNNTSSFQSECSNSPSQTSMSALPFQSPPSMNSASPVHSHISVYPLTTLDSPSSDYSSTAPPCSSGSPSFPYQSTTSSFSVRSTPIQQSPLTESPLLETHPLMDQTSVFSPPSKHSTIQSTGSTFQSPLCSPATSISTFEPPIPNHTTFRAEPSMLDRFKTSFNSSSPVRDTPTPKPNTAPLSSSAAPPSLGASKPTCSFFFSPKMNSLRHLKTAVGKASGKPPSPEKPKVKFIFKGLFKSKNR